MHTMNRNGFTLIELLTSAAIFSIIIGAAYAVFHAGLTMKERADARLVTLQGARFALERIREDLQSAALFGEADTYLFEGIDALGDDGADDDTLDFLTFANKRASGADAVCDQCEVGYCVYADPESGASALYRRIDTTVDEDVTAGGAYEAIADGVVSLNIEYFDGLLWNDEHTSDDELPERVRVTLGFSAPGTAGALTTHEAVIRLAHAGAAGGVEDVE